MYTMLLRAQTTEFNMNAILPIVSYTTGFGFPIQFAYWLKATSFIGEACETNCLLVRTESCWKEDLWNSSVSLFAASCKFQHGTYVLRGVAWASANEWH